MESIKTERYRIIEKGGTEHTVDVQERPSKRFGKMFHAIHVEPWTGHSNTGFTALEACVAWACFYGMAAEEILAPGVPSRAELEAAAEARGRSKEKSAVLAWHREMRRLRGQDVEYAMKHKNAGEIHIANMVMTTHERAIAAIEQDEHRPRES